jgi:hypothetical protein
MFVNFDYLPIYVSYEIDEFFRFALTDKLLIEYVITNELYKCKTYQKLAHGHATDWNTSDATALTALLPKKTFNENINNWDVSKIKDMSGLFRGFVKFNQPLNNWDVSNVENMIQTFESCYEFNQPLDKWNVSKAKSMCGMFSHCFKFNQSLNNWNISNVKVMFLIFNLCHALNQPLNLWDVSRVDKYNIIFGCDRLSEENKPRGL